jgi:hypothetical protein
MEKFPAIRTSTPDDLVFVSETGDQIWLSIHVRHGGANVTMTPAQAQVLIDQLTEVVNAQALK